MALMMNKRLYKAELRAGKKVKTMRAKKKKDQPIRRDWAWKPRWQPQLSSLSSSITQPSSSESGSRPSVGRPQSTLGPCFECGRTGHLRKSCPELLLHNLIGSQKK